MIVAGILSPIENALSDVLIWLHGTAGLSWAWSIVALTVMVRVLLVPVALRQIHSMQSLQIHAPEMKVIQQRYKGDRQRQSEELMKFYKENKINPYAPCLPIVFQIPIFFSLYFVLKNAEKHLFKGSADQALGWIHLVNITEPVKDGWGPALIVVYVASQLLSTYLMSTQMQSAAQKWMIMVLPIAFIPFIIRFPTGLVVYWVTTNLWTTGQGIVTRRLMPRAVLPTKRSSRTPPKEASEEQAPQAAAASQQASSGGGSGAPRRVKKKRGGRSKR